MSNLDNEGFFEAYDKQQKEKKSRLEIEISRLEALPITENPQDEEIDLSKEAVQKAIRKSFADGMRYGQEFLSTRSEEDKKRDDDMRIKGGILGAMGGVIT